MSQSSNPEESFTSNLALDKAENFLKRTTNIFEDVAKLISFVSALAFPIGAFVLWSYLNSVGLTQQFYDVFSSPPTLLMLALISILLAISLVSLTIISPSTYRYAESLLFQDMSGRKFWRNFIFDFFIFSVYIGSPMFLSILSQKSSVPRVNESNISSYILWSWVGSTIIFMVIKFIWHRQVPLIDRIGSAWFFFLALSASYLPLLLSLGFVQALALDSNKQEWLWFFALLFIYAFTASASVSMDNAFLGPIFIVVLVSCLIMAFSPDVIVQGAIESSGIGRYQATILIDSQYQTLLDQNEDVTGKCSPGDGNSNVLCEEIWIIVDLPSNIAIADKSASEELTLLPQSAVLGREVELGN